MPFPKKKTSVELNKQIQRYGLWWQPTTDDLWAELEMIKRGGQWKTKKGTTVGEGLAFHFKRAIQLAWPWVKFHKWLDLCIENYAGHRTVIIIGAASTGKTFFAAAALLIDYYAFPGETTIIACSTTRERLEDRLFGEVKKLHKDVLTRKRWIPGHLIESRQRIITDERVDAEDGRDFRNGIVGVGCLSGGSFIGLGSFVGLKNKRVRLVADELSLLPRVLVDSISNLDKNSDFKMLGLGNPKDTTDALGVLAEPAAFLGGWEGGIDQTPITKTWQTRRTDGIL
jgi:hypothetical protein